MKRADARILVILVVLSVIVLWFRSTKEWFSDPDPKSTVCRNVKRATYKEMSMHSVIDAETCRQIIKAAEKHAANVGGWETTRHDDYPTTDFDTADIPTLKYPIQNIVYRDIIPQMAAAYGLDPLELGIDEVFIAKYSVKGGEQRSLGKHTDGSDFSFVVALNDDFKGGGTKFSKSGVLHKPGVGSAVGFCGKAKHQGIAVTSGVRYILAGFLTYKTPDGCHSIHKKGKK